MSSHLPRSVTGHVVTFSRDKHCAAALQSSRKNYDDTALEDIVYRLDNIVDYSRHTFADNVWTMKCLEDKKKQLDNELAQLSDKEFKKFPTFAKSTTRNPYQSAVLCCSYLIEIFKRDKYSQLLIEYTTMTRKTLLTSSHFDKHDDMDKKMAILLITNLIGFIEEHSPMTPYISHYIDDLRECMKLML